MGLEAFQIVVVVELDGGVLDGAVHSLGLPIGPRMVGLGQPVLDVVGDADAVEDVRAKEAAARAIAVLGQAGEGHAVVGQHSMDLVREALDHIPQEGRAFHLPGAVVELDIGELRDPVDRQEHDEPAVGMSQLAAVEVDVADLIGLEPLALGLGLFDRQPGDAVALEAALQGAPAEVGDGIPQAAQHVVQRQQRLLAEGHHDGFLGRRQHRALGNLRAHLRIGRRGPLAPLGHRLRVQAVAGGKGPGALLRRLELGSKMRRRAGAAVKNISRSASSS